MRLKMLVPCLAAATLLGGCINMLPFTTTTQTARIRVVHASPDAPNVDVCSGSSILFQNAAFNNATAYANATAGDVPVKVIASGAGCDSAGVIEATLQLGADTDTTVVAVDTLANIRPIVLTDDNMAPAAGQARVRFVHVSPDAPTVDITLADGTTLFDNVAFGENGGYISVNAGTVDLQVRDETGTTVVLNLPGVVITDGAVITILATGLLNGTPALGTLITVDNNPQPQAGI